MLQKVLQTIQTYRMLSPGDKVIVGLSGGADSVALLHLLKKSQDHLNIHLFAAHVNHGLRGEAAGGDAAFVQNLCKQWDIPVYFKEADVRALAQTMGQSEEEVGRQIRYDFFNWVKTEVGGNKIATAHHKNDQAETILHNLIRGTGMQGLTGIQPVSGNLLIRPLIEVTKVEIMEYLELHQLFYREDATNQDSVYTRNRIRNQLIPSLEKDFNPDIVDSLTRMAGILREEEGFLTGYSEYIYHKDAQPFDGRITFDLYSFLTYHRTIQKRLVRMALNELRGNLHDVASIHVDAVLKLAEVGRTGSKTIIPGSDRGAPEVQAEVSYGNLQLQKAGDPLPSAILEHSLDLPGQLTLEVPPMKITAEKTNRNEGLAFSPECIYIDGDKIKGKLIIRSRKNGDRFQPLGMQGTKKLKDFFIDRKVPAAQRDFIPLLVDEENIIWVAGYQMHQDYRITRSSENIVKICMKNFN